MADYYRKERQINGTRYQVHALVTDDVEAKFSLTAGEVGSEQSLLKGDHMFTLSASDLPALRRAMNHTLHGLGVGAQLEQLEGDKDASQDFYPRAYFDWDDDQDQALRIQWEAGNEIESIARALGRSPGSIRRRLRHLGESPDAPWDSQPSQSRSTDEPPMTGPDDPDTPPPAEPTGGSGPPTTPPAAPSAPTPPPSEPAEPDPRRWGEGWPFRQSR